MRDRRERERRRESEVPVKTRSPDIEELSTDKIKQQVMKDAIECPTTIFPLAIAALAVIYLLLVSPFMGGAVQALFVAAGSGIIAACSWGWMLFVRGANKIKEKMEEFTRLGKERAERAKEEELINSEKAVRSGFNNIGSREGMKALNELVYEYNQIKELLVRLESSKKQSTFSIERVKNMAFDMYKLGLSVLTDALEMMTLVDTTDAERLREEIIYLSNRNTDLRKSKLYDEIVERNETAIKEKEELLKKLDARKVSIEKLLDESDRCETALQYTRIEIPNLTVEAGDKLDELILKLRTTMDYASQLQEELRKQGF